jgi:cobalt/nickel transport system ATP-binding protein
MTLAVEVKGLRFTYPDGRQALSDVDLEVEPGERLAVLGPNGAGKSTLMLHLNGIHTPSSGNIWIGGTEIGPSTLTEIRRRVGLVFQDTNDQLFMPTVFEDVAFGPANLGLRGDELEERVEEALARVSAADTAHRAPHHLSGGEKRRVSIATVLAMRPDLLVLDEPAVGLDPSGRRDLITTLANLNVTQLIVTHDLPLALELCERAVIMFGGRVVASGPTRQLLSDAQLLGRSSLEMPYEFKLAEDRLARERLLGLVRASRVFYEGDPSPAELETALISLWVPLAGKVMEAELSAQTAVERAAIDKWSQLVEALQSAAEKAGKVKQGFLPDDSAE